MDSDNFPLIVVGILLLALVIRLLAGGMDGDRLEIYLRQRGAELLSREWTPFGTGWYGSQNERIYRIRYRDREGNEHEAQCKTSLFAGVYLTEDRIVKQANPESPSPESPPVAASSSVVHPAAPGEADDLARLEEENRRLREELDRLREA